MSWVDEEVRMTYGALRGGRLRAREGGRGSTQRGDEEKNITATNRMVIVTS
jgi:hypothetical protein